MEDGGEVYDELAGVEVSEIQLIGLVRIRFGEGRTRELSIERDFTIRTGDNLERGVVEFRPYQTDWKPTGMDDLASIFGSVVDQASAQPDATLLITFTDGKSLEVQPDPHYEGWHFWLDGVLHGQMAGGNLM